MNRQIVFVLIATLLLSVEPSPAPIQEVQESPTPAPTQAPKPKIPRPSKPKTGSFESHSRAASAPTAAPIQNKFDGTWMGTLPNLPFVGNVDFTLFVGGGGTSVVEKSATLGTNNFQANCDGVIMKWETGSSWTLTPNPDGQAALVTCNSPGFFGVGAFSLSAVFRRVSTSITATQSSVPVVTNTSGPAPVAKAVPDRPGFVYNPFDPNSRILLDVRGKPSGTKLIEPKSGKLFIVP